MLVVALILYQKIVITLNNSKMLDFCITNNVIFFSYFENCLEALNDTYLLAYSLVTIALPY